MINLPTTIINEFQGLLAQVCLSALLAIVGVAAAAKVLKKIRVAFSSLWRKSRFSFAAVMLLFLTMFLWADKTNLLRMIIHPGGPPVVVSAEDILRGFRLEGIVTNDEPLCDMPVDAVEYPPWRLRAGRETDFPLNLGGFVFPYGTNAINRFRVLSGGTIETYPKLNAPVSICAAREYASLIPGVSRFWSADANGGSEKVLRWESVFANRDRTGEYSAEIRLSANGDFSTRSNALETVYRRVNPHDWDGDGLANEIDANPAAYDGDCFETGVGWLNVNCAGVLSAVTNGQGEVEITWHTNANPNAYYWLDLTATGALGVAKITATCDGESNLGDLAVIARTNEVYRVPLLVGATYTIESDLPISYSAVSSEHASIFTNSEHSLVVSFPLEFHLERVLTRSGGGPVNYAVSSSPVNVFPNVAAVFGGCCSPQAVDGLLQWSCSSTCTCGGENHYIDVVSLWEGYSKAFLGYALCACGYDAPNPIPTPVAGPSAASISVNFGKDAVIFEDAYENKPGEWMSRRSTATALTIHANGGPNGGLLTVFGTNLGKLQKNSGPAFPIQSVEVPANESITYEMNYVGLAASETTNDVAVTATISENLTGENITSSSTVTVVRVELEACKAAPSNSDLHRHVFGVLEDFHYCQYPANAAASWRFFEGEEERFPFSSGYVILPPTTNQTSEGHCEFHVTCGTASYTNAFLMVLPQIEARNPRCNENLWPVMGEAGWLLLHLDLYVGPPYVSFYGVDFQEIPDESGNCPHEGYYNDISKGGWLSHCKDAGAGVWHRVLTTNGYLCSDMAGRAGRYEVPWSNGWKEWPIPVGWGVVEKLRAQFDAPPTTQKFTLTSDGTFTIRKYGFEATRSIININPTIRSVEE